jgi:hypothetical protein
MYWTGRDWTGPYWTGLDWTGLDYTGLDGLYWIELDWTGMDWTRQIWFGLDWTIVSTGLGCAGLGWTFVLCFADWTGGGSRLNRTGFDRT